MEKLKESQDYVEQNSEYIDRLSKSPETKQRPVTSFENTRIKKFISYEEWFLRKDTEENLKERLMDNVREIQMMNKTE